MLQYAFDYFDYFEYLMFSIHWFLEITGLSVFLKGHCIRISIASPGL